ncbi:tetratricopeptide repeat protein [Rheinheimera maricola]|uniref:Tetratricopeptide repeat protein n=1 Tax=Rheinheimera maricola TaxID=2793282 RepID=A0ABS7XB34_9GAMM|nr:tetratricopeptide repeat protein [Rheinheimera maricola]MBZ9612773.1 tetratricopeptide repeat protein [Rheinheimera maricola]
MRWFFSIVMALGLSSANATEFKPAAGQQIILQAELPETADMQQLRQALMYQRDSTATLPLAQLYLIGARQPGYDDWFHQAEQLLRNVDDAARQGLEYWLLLADVQQQQHQFAAALLSLEQVFALQPRHIQASLMAARVYLALHQLEPAQQACSRIWQQDLFLFSVCSYEVAGRRGDWQQSYVALQQLWQRQSSLPPAIDIWLRGILAEQAEQLGLFETAQQWLSPVLAQAPTSLWLKWADLSLLLGQADAVYQSITAIPQRQNIADSLLLRLAMAEQQLAKPAQFGKQLGERMQLRLARGDTDHAADLALYFLHFVPDPAAAVHWAELNYQRAKEPDDVRLLTLSQQAQQQSLGSSE